MSATSQDYARNPPLNEADVAPEPLTQFQRWLADAVAAEMIEPTAMTLATVDAQGRPSARVVLFKGLHEGGLTFYTNYEGRKGRELVQNAHVALVFWWDKLERQIRVEGTVTRLSPEVSRVYFDSRPRGSRVGAIVSRQSAVVASREALDARYEARLAEFEGQDIPLPEYWGGYRVEIATMEFWQGRRKRLHDRLQYLRDGDGWRLQRLEP